MNRLMNGIFAGVLALSTTAAISPGYALPFQHTALAGQDTANQGLIKVQGRDGIRPLGHFGGRHHLRRGGHRRGHYRGHRGYSRHHGGYYRRGYNHGGSFVGPAAGFIAGAIVGNVIANSGRHRGSAHVRWCYDHYRSYRAFDDTFQPYHGPRRRCRGSY